MCLLLLHLHKEKGANFSRPLSSLAMESEYPGHVFHAQQSATLQLSARFQLSLHAVSWPNGLLARVFQRLCKMTDDFCWCSITLGISQLVLIISEDVCLSLLAAKPSSHWTSVSLVFNSAILFLLHLIWFLFQNVFGIFFKSLSLKALYICHQNVTKYSKDITGCFEVFKTTGIFFT